MESGNTERTNDLAKVRKSMHLSDTDWLRLYTVCGKSAVLKHLMSLLQPVYLKCVHMCAIE